MMKKRALLIALKKGRSKQTDKYVFGAWNTRCFGATEGQIDPAMKAEALIALWEARGWAAVLLSDVKFAHNGVREYIGKTGKWVVVIQGKVAIALNEVMTALWRTGGAKTMHAGQARKTRLWR